MKRAMWKKRLDPFAETWYDFQAMLRRRLDGLPSKELRAISRATEKPSSTNCGWATYQVAPFVRRRIQEILYRRVRADATPCEQCGKSWRARACGTAHESRAAELRWWNR